MDPEKLSALIRRAEWGTYCNAEKIYASMEISFSGEVFRVASENENRCATCILSLMKGESAGECWAVDSKKSCLRCQFEYYCQESSSTLRRLGALAQKIRRANDGQTYRDLQRLHTVANLQWQNDIGRPCKLKKMHVDFYVAELRDLLATYCDNSDPDESTEVSDYINVDRGKGAEVLMPMPSGFEVEEESSCSGASDDTGLLTPTDSCSTVWPLHRRDDSADLTADSTSTLDLNRLFSSNMNILDKFDSFPSMYKNSADETMDLLATFVKHKGHIPGIYATIMPSDTNTDNARFFTVIDRAIRHGVVPYFPAYYEYKKKRKGQSHNGEMPAGNRNTTGETSTISSGNTARRGPDSQPQERFAKTGQQRVGRGVRPSRPDQDQFTKKMSGCTLEGLGQFVDGAKWAVEALKYGQDNECEDDGRDDEAAIHG